jgi:hypothetical protein
VYDAERVLLEADDPLPAPVAVSIDAVALASLPFQRLQSLEQALIHLDTRATSREIEAIRAHDVQLSQDLALLAEDFQYERILCLMRGRNGGPAWEESA